MENTIDILTTKKLKHHLRENKETRDALCIARDEVPLKIKHCSDNIELVFYLDNVLEDPIYLTVGSAENRLHISIRSNGKIEYYWKERTLKVILWDALESVTSVVVRTLTEIFNRAVDRVIAYLVERFVAWYFAQPAPEQRSDKKNT